MGSQRSFSFRGVEWWWRDAKRTSLAAKFWIFWRGWMTELGVPMRRQFQDSSQAVRGFKIKTRVLAASSVRNLWTELMHLSSK